jgi:hypothetical protein
MRRASGQPKGELEKLHAQADRTLTQKADEITEMTRVVEETEQQLSAIQAELAAKIKQTEMEDESDSEDHESSMQNEAEALQIQQDLELDQIRQSHAVHIKTLKETFEKSIQEAEKWAENHAEAVKTERTVQLDQAKKQLDEIRTTKADSRFTANQSRTRSYQQSKGLSVQNGERIRLLEAQISEISAATREEARDVKTKINECLASIEVRQRQHQLELAGYESEEKRRQPAHALHLKQTEHEAEAEKKRLEQAVVGEKAKSENLKKLVKQFEATQKRSIQTGHADIQKLKGLVAQYKSQSLKGLDQTRDSVSRTGQFERRTRQVKQEILVVEQEIAELEAENADLRTQLAKLDDSVYRSQ